MFTHFTSSTAGELRLIFQKASPESSSQSPREAENFDEDWTKEFIDKKIANLGINFEGSDKTAKRTLSEKLFDVAKDLKLTRSETEKLVLHVDQKLKRARFYVEQFPPVEIVQSLASLISTGNATHFIDYVPNKSRNDLEKNLYLIAQEIRGKDAKGKE